MDEYENIPVEICFDIDSQMLYVTYKGRNMFFPRNWDEEKVENIIVL